MHKYKLVVVIVNRMVIQLLIIIQLRVIQLLITSVDFCKFAVSLLLQRPQRGQSRTTSWKNGKTTVTNFMTTHKISGGEYSKTNPRVVGFRILAVLLGEVLEGVLSSSVVCVYKRGLLAQLTQHQYQ